MERVFTSTGLLRLPQIIGTVAASPRTKELSTKQDRSHKRERKTVAPFYDPIIPVSRSTWWAGVKDGRYPRPIKLSERCTAWRVEDIRALIERLAAAGHEEEGALQ
jgi:prophage regulatory protein